MSAYSLLRVFFVVVLVSFLGRSIQAADGYAADVTGGEGGKVVTVRSAEELKTAAEAPGRAVIQIEGQLTIGTVNVTSDKTLVGVGSGATLRGNLTIGSGATNIIVQNLTLTNPMTGKGKGGGDGITIRRGGTVWVDHCTFVDCGDGCIDITEGANAVTVSWCKFSFTKQPEHRFTMLVIGLDKKKGKAPIRLTLHHNWWAENCDQRMPAARRARVHMYNNYFTCKDNSYCSNARKDAELLSERNFYDGVRNPCYGDKGSKIRTSDNIYRNCHGKISDGRDSVFKPPYKYKMDKTKDVPKVVKQGAGAR